jgi:hypothetical protein
MMTLKKVVNLYYAKSLHRLTPPDKGAARRIVAQALETPTSDKFPSAQTLDKILNLLID